MSAQMDQHPVKPCLCDYIRCADPGFEGTLGELEGAGSNRRRAVTWEGEGRGDILPVLGLDPPRSAFSGLASPSLPLGAYRNAGGGQGGLSAAEARSSARALGDLLAVRKRILSESPLAANIPRLKRDERLSLYG